MSPSAYSIAVIMQRGWVTATGKNDTVKSTPSSMDDPSVHVLEYISYWLSMSVFLTLKDILVLGIFVFGGNNEHKNGALKIVDVSIF